MEVIIRSPGSSLDDWLEAEREILGLECNA